MTFKYIIGCGDVLDYVCDLWGELEPLSQQVRIDLKQDDAYQFDYSFLKNLDKNNSTAFIAIDDQFLNQRRLELMGAIKSLGFKLPTLVAKNTLISRDVKFGENCLVGPGSIIQNSVKIGFNTFICSGSFIGSKSSIGNSVFIGNKVNIGLNCDVKNFVTIKNFSTVSDGVTIGKNGFITANSLIKNNIHDNEFLENNFSGVIKIYSP